MITNAEHYPTSLGKIRGFLRFCRHHTCRTCPLFDGDRQSRLCALRWLPAKYEPIHNRERADIIQDDLFATEDTNNGNEI